MLKHYVEKKHLWYVKQKTVQRKPWKDKGKTREKELGPVVVATNMALHIHVTLGRFTVTSKDPAATYVGGHIYPLHREGASFAWQAWYATLQMRYDHIWGRPLWKFTLLYPIFPRPKLRGSMGKERCLLLHVFKGQNGQKRGQNGEQELEQEMTTVFRETLSSFSFSRGQTSLNEKDSLISSRCSWYKGRTQKAAIVFRRKLFLTPVNDSFPLFGAKKGQTIGGLQKKFYSFVPISECRSMAIDCPLSLQD